jgi:hypothetical protein
VSDQAILDGLATLERAAATTYAAYAAGSVLDARSRALMRRLGANSAAHAALLAELGAAAPSTGGAAVSPRTAADVLTHAIDLERRMLRSYEDALRALTLPRWLQQLGTIVGGHGQHLAALELAQGR